MSSRSYSREYRWPTIMKNTQAQFNGAVLLYGYLQRLFVYEKIQTMLNVKRVPIDMEDLTSHLDSVSGAMQKFDQRSGLTLAQQQKLISALETVQTLMPATLSSESIPNTSHKLAVAGAALYAEEHINNGLILLGTLFDPEIADRFRQQIPHFQNRVKMINSFVEKTVRGKSLAGEEAAHLDSLYQNLTQNAAHIETDFQTIRDYLAAPSK